MFGKTPPCAIHSRQEIIQFLIVSDRQLEMSRNDPGFLVVTSSITSEFQNFSSKILHNRGQINGSASSNSFGIITLAQESMNTSNWKLKSSSRGSGFSFSLDFATFAACRHFEYNAYVI